MAGPFKNFANLKAFQTTPAELLRDFLMPFISYFESRNILISEISETSHFAESLFKVFAEPDAKMPDELLYRLHQVDDLATTVGHDALIDAARKMGVIILAEREEISPRGLALRTFLRFPKVFSHAHDLHEIESVDKFAEFAPRTESKIRSEPEQRHLDDLTDLMKPFFRKRGRGDYCKVRTYTDGHEVNFVITHGCPFRVEGHVDGSDAERSISFRPYQVDVLKYDNRRFRLKIKARDKATTEAYRKSFGQALFGDESLFEGKQLVTLSPLRDSGRRSILPSHGLASVTLTGLKIVHDNLQATVLVLESEDVFADLEEQPGLILDSGEFVFARFSVCFNGHKRARKLEIRPPNQVSYNRSYFPGVIQAFLEARGFDIGGRGTES